MSVSEKTVISPHAKTTRLQSRTRFPYHQPAYKPENRASKLEISDPLPALTVYREHQKTARDHGRRRVVVTESIRRRSSESPTHNVGNCGVGDRAHGRCGTRPRGTRSRRGRSTKEKDLQRRSFLDRGGGGVKLARGESSERTFLSFFLSFLSTFSPSSRSMRDAITVQLAHAISSRRCLLPSYLFFWPPEAAPSRPPLPPLAAAILVISGETQLRYFAPDLGFHSIPLGREPR